MRRKPKEMNAAFERVTEGYFSVEGNTMPWSTYDGGQVLEMMVGYASRCEEEPRTFDELSVSTYSLKTVLTKILSI